MKNQTITRNWPAEPKPRSGKGWPPARRAAQAARCRAQQPWRHSTGPRTAAGKAIVADNGRRHSRQTPLIRYLKPLLRRHWHFLRWLDTFHSSRHCEERSDEAIQEPRQTALDCFACARNDGGKIPISDFRLQNSAQSAYTYI